MHKKIIPGIFFVLVCLSILAPLWVFADLLFPYVTSKAFYFRICIEAALPFYLYLLVARKELRPNFRRNPLNIIMAVFFLLNVISSFAGVSVVRSFWGNFERMGGAFYVGTLTLLYFYVFMIAKMGGNYLKRFLQFFLATALVVTVNGIFGKLGLPILVKDPSLPARVSSTLGNPIYVGSFLIIPMFISIFFGSQAEEKLKKWTYYFVAFLFLVGIFLSATRGAFVGLVAGGFLSGLVYLALLPKSKLKFLGWISVVVFGLICSFLFAFNSHLPQGSALRRLFTLKDSNTEARFIQWGVALKGYKDHPLFGVGPENYYVIANKYYNPAIFNYDRSWFDKPHNYPLEILVTDGAFGFLAYAAMLVFIVWALYRGYKTGFLSAFEFSALLAALLAYQIQNLTVFDTVPASLTFYCYAGFAGFLWDSAIREDKQKSSSKKNKLGPLGALPTAVFCVSLPLTSYLVYATCVVPMQISGNVNYGYAYTSVDPQKAYNYFQNAADSPFNFDKTETAQKYAESAVGLAQSVTPATADISTKMLDGAIASLNDAVTTEPTYPILWIELSQTYIFKGVKDGKLVSIDPRAETAINKAIAVSPIREEGFLNLAQIRSLSGDNAGAENILSNLLVTFPNDSGVLMQLSNLSRIEGKMDRAAELTEWAQSKGYVFPSVKDMAWLLNYYENSKQYDKALALAETGAALEPNNLDAMSDLAKLYLQTGNSQQAINLAKAIMQADPTRQKAMQEIISAAIQPQK